MSDFSAKLKGLVKLGSATKARGSTGTVPIQSFTHQGKTGDTMNAYPYGFDANAPAEALSVMLAIEGNAENRVSLPMAPFEWAADLASGEVRIFHPLTGSQIRFQADGSVLIDAPEVTFTGNVTVQGTTTLGSVVTSGVKNIGATHTHGGGPVPD